MSDNMVNDEQFTPIKLRNEIIHEIDKIIDNNPFVRTRPQVIKYILHRYIEEQEDNNNGGNGAFSTTQTSDPISPTTQKNGEKRS